ncbi:uncharacterized protein LOC128512665 [Clarias gariepinus]|uniref:uncharacterized protein LOC128512665 n=1 Tax=Clarias gariepinus TaxID=13013 RepID=UPI00234E1AB6|nr:uncharacterized protein LOC128512665 [Clarias gariepinus]
MKIQSDDKNECEKYDFTTTAELSGSEEELPMKRRPKKKIYPDYQIDEPSVNEDSKKESSPGLMIKSTGEKATKKIRTFIPCEDDFVLPTPPKMNNAQSGKYGTTTNTMKRRIPHSANTRNGNQAKKRLRKDDFVLPTPPKMTDAQLEPKWTSPQDLNPWHTVVAAVPLSLFVMIEDHSALGLTKRVTPDPFPRGSVGVPQGLSLIDRDHSALGLVKRVSPDPFPRGDVGVPQGLPLINRGI